MDYLAQLQASLHRYCQEYNIDNISRESMSRWNHGLQFMHDDLFPDRHNLLVEPYAIGNLKHGNMSNYNSYDTDKLSEICDAYIYICYDNSKEISIHGYCRLTGMSPATIFLWAKVDDVNTSSFDFNKKEIYHKICREREESLSNKLVSGSGNPVGILAILNRFYGWNISQPRGQPVSSKPQSLDAIAAKYGVPIQQTDE